MFLVLCCVFHLFLGPHLHFTLALSVRRNTVQDGAAAAADEGPDGCMRHVFIISPCPITGKTLATALGTKSPPTLKNLSKRLSHKILTTDLQKSFAAKRVALHWIDARGAVDGPSVNAHDTIGQDCVRDALTTRFGGRLLPLRTLCHASLLGVPVDLRTIFGRSDKSKSVTVTATARFCDKDTVVDEEEDGPSAPCCWLRLYPVFRSRVGGGVMSGNTLPVSGRVAMDGRAQWHPTPSTAHSDTCVPSRTTRDAKKRKAQDSVAIRLAPASKGSDSASSGARHIVLCLRATMPVTDIASVMSEDSKYVVTTTVRSLLVLVLFNERQSSGSLEGGGV